MKNIRVMLTAIAVLAVVGGALAFKAQKFSLKKICIGTGAAKANCQILKANWTTTDLSDTFSYYTQVADDATDCAVAVTDAGCPTQTYIKPE